MNDLKEAVPVFQRVIQNMERVVLGKTQQIKLVLCAWLAGGHVLIEDVPGTGKTILARALAQSVDVGFKRVQFTPDLLPSDILGTSIYNRQTGRFELYRGPIFTSVLLGDEINRATPRTQSALLEAMAESQVSIDGQTHRLDPGFFVLATQNPLEHQGTFPLPEAQLDRFMIKISMGYPNRASEIQMIKSQNIVHPIHELKPAISADAFLKIRQALPQIQVSEEIFDYALGLVEATRKHPAIRLGASPRATLALIRASQAMALMEGRPYVSPSAVFQLSRPILEHRIVLAADARVQGQTTQQVLNQVIAQIPVPMGGA